MAKIDGRYRYRWYHDINWGPGYDAKTGAHYGLATDLLTILTEGKPRPSIPHLQVHDGIKYRWVTEIPEYFGGIAQHWHNERI